MKALKGFMVYTGIVLLSIVVISAFTIGIMFFTKMNVFGWYFLQTHEKNQFIMELNFKNLFNVNPESQIPYEVTKVNLNIKTNAYGVQVYPVGSDNFAIYTDNDYIGFLKDNADTEGYKDDIIPTATYELESHNSNGEIVFNIELHEPDGLLAISDSSLIKLQVPHVLSGKVTPIIYNINATTRNGNIMLSNSVDKNGDIDKALVVGGLSLATEKGDVIIQGFGNKSTGAETKNITLDHLNIKTNGGTFDFTNFDTVTVKEKVVLDSNKATYLFNALICNSSVFPSTINGSVGDKLGVITTTSYSGTGGVEITGNNIKFTADRVYCGSDGFIYKSSTGLLKIGKLWSGKFKESVFAEVEMQNKVLVSTGVVKRRITEASPYENTVFTDSALVEIGNIIGKLGLYNGYGNVVIDLLSHQATITTDNGDIVIRKSGYLLNEFNEDKVFTDTSSMILYSTFGNIYATEYYQDAVIYSKKGKIEAHSKYKTQKTERYYYSDISTKDGQITATTDKNPIKIVATDSANIKLTIKDILPATKNPFGEGVDMYQAITKNGTVDVILPLKTYDIKVVATKIQGSIGATTSFGSEYVKINYDEKDTTRPQMLMQGNKVILACAV